MKDESKIHSHSCGSIELAKRCRKALKQARKVIKDEANWTQNVEARRADGSFCPPQSEEAVCWCTVGAIEKVTPEDSYVSDYAVRVLARAAGLYVTFSVWGDLGIWNDRSTHAEVMAAFDKAIAKSNWYRTCY